MSGSVNSERTARLRRALAPAGVAVIGASPRPGSLSARFVSGLLRHGFPGRVVPVNPNYDEVLGLPCAPDIGAAGPDRPGGAVGASPAGARDARGLRRGRRGRAW